MLYAQSYLLPPTQKSNFHFYLTPGSHFKRGAGPALILLALCQLLHPDTFLPVIRGFRRALGDVETAVPA
jgi:hypothetical protein